MAPRKSWPDRVLVAATCTLVATLPWLQTTQFNDVQTAPKQMVLLVCAAIGLLALWWDGVQLPKARSVLVPLALFAAAALLSTAFATDPRASLLGWYGHRFGLVTLLALPVPFLLGAGVTERYGFRPLAIAGLIGVAVAALTAFLQEVGVGGVFAATRTANRSNGGAGSANDLAACMALGTAFLAPLASKRWRIPTLAGATGLITFGSVASGGRLGALALLSALVLAGVLLFIRFGWRSRALRPEAMGLIAGVALGLLLAAATGSLGTLAGRYQARTPEESVLGKDSLEIGVSGTIRFELWRAGLGAALARPLVGHGPDSFVLINGKYRDPNSPAMDERPQILYPSAHSIVFDYAANLGLLGLAALITIAIAVVLPTLRRIRTTPPHIPYLIAGLAGYSAMVLVNPEPIAASPVAWVLLGCCTPLGRPLRRPARILARSALAASAVGATALALAIANAEVIAHKAVEHTRAGDFRAASLDWKFASDSLPFELRYQAYRSLTLALLGAQSHQREDLEVALRASSAVNARFEPLAPDLLREAALLTLLEPGSPKIEATLLRLRDVQPYSGYWIKLAQGVREDRSRLNDAK